jgi:hypothetical protein
MLKKTHIARNRLVTLALTENVAVLLQRTTGKLGFFPKIWCEEAV